MFNQIATGKFTVDVTGPYHCGPDHTTPKTFEYCVDITYDDSALDSNGFLLDNTTFRDYYQSLGSISWSCELLARESCRAFHQLAAGRARSIKTTITVPGLASIEYLMAN